MLLFNMWHYSVNAVNIDHDPLMLMRLTLSMLIQTSCPCGAQKQLHVRKACGVMQFVFTFS